MNTLLLEVERYHAAPPQQKKARANSEQRPFHKGSIPEQVIDLLRAEGEMLPSEIVARLPHLRRKYIIVALYDLRKRGFVSVENDFHRAEL